MLLSYFADFVLYRSFKLSVELHRGVPLSSRRHEIANIAYAHQRKAHPHA